MAIKLLPFWRDAWKLWSVRIAALAATVSTVLIVSPEIILNVWNSLPEDIKVHIPPRYIRMIAPVLMIASIFARIVHQPKLTAQIEQKMLDKQMSPFNNDPPSSMPTNTTLVILFSLTLLAFSSHVVAAAPAFTTPLTGAPTAGSGSVSVKLSWATKDAVKCTASGLWSGDKPLTGSETVVATTTGEFVLTCVGTGTTITAPVNLSWKAPTQNTDNTPLTNLAGFRIYYGPGTNNLETKVTLNQPNLERTSIDVGKAGTYYFAITAFATTGAESDFSKRVSKTIESVTTQAPTVQNVVPVTVTTVPNPPTDLVVIDAQVYRLDQALNAVRLVNVGTAPLGAKCDKGVTMMGYYRVDRSLVTLKAGQFRPNVALAKCG